MNSINYDISIIIPVYNSENYIGRCLESLINQTKKEIEIIIIDDGSSDNSKDIIYKYMNNDKRIKYLYINNSGVSTARNIGIDIASGKYISFVDSDDWCDSNMFEEMYRFSENGKIDFINIGYLVEDLSGKKIYSKKSKENRISYDYDEISITLLENELGYCLMKLYKKSIIDINNIRFKKNINLGEDSLFVLNYLMYIESIATISKEAYHYVQCNSNSLSKKYNDNLKEMFDEFWYLQGEVNKKFYKYSIEIKRLGYIKGIQDTIMQTYNIYRIGSPFSRKDRVIFIRKLMNNNNIQEKFKNYKPINLKHRIFKFFYLIKFPNLMDLFYRNVFRN